MINSLCNSSYFELPIEFEGIVRVAAWECMRGHSTIKRVPQQPVDSEFWQWIWQWILYSNDYNVNVGVFCTILCTVLLYCNTQI